MVMVETPRGNHKYKYDEKIGRKHALILSRLVLYLMPSMALSCSRTRIGDLDSTIPEPSRIV